MEKEDARLGSTVNRACERLDVGRTLMYELIAAGEIRTIKIAGRTIIPERELEAFIERKLKEAA